MIEFERFSLSNGLTLLVHQDPDTPMVAFNLAYHVGSKDEQSERTGLAHLFEHLMFGGSENVANFDEPLEAAGGQSNAFTSNDYTNYYITIPVQNLETAFWLESDRMISPSLSAESIRIQKSVVIEEYNQRNVNQPYGDVWDLLRPLAYKTHPYRWPVIGMDMKHIEEASDEEIRRFFETHYTPGNAVLCVAGPVDTEDIVRLTEKWFSTIYRPYSWNRSWQPEPEQTERRKLSVIRQVPQDALYFSFHAPGRMDPEFCTSDLLCDMLSGGESSPVYRSLVIEQELFSELDIFTTGDMENSMLVLGGKLMDTVRFEVAEAALWKQLAMFNDSLNEHELTKVKNRLETALAWGKLKAMDKAMALCYFELLGNAAMINQEAEAYRKVSLEDCKRFAGKVFDENKVSVLYYTAENGLNADETA